MARKSYYRPYRRSYRSKAHWASNMKSGSLTQSGSGTIHAEDVLVSNSAQVASPTPVLVKTGNFKVQGDCYLTSTSGFSTTTSVVVYVMYLPEVVVASANVITTIQDHPEWIMGWKLVDINVSNITGSASTASFSFSTRLKRNLNSGDTIALVAVLRDAGSGSVSFVVNYTAQYFTRAN